MDWRVLFGTFGAVFLAELGDKTQLATLGLAAENKRLPVFLGSAAALTTTSLLAVLAGGLIAKYVPPIYLKRAAGALFLLLGAWTLFKS